MFLYLFVKSLTALFSASAALPLASVTSLYYSGAETWGTGGTVPPKFEVGDGPCIGPPNI